MPKVAGIDVHKNFLEVAYRDSKDEIKLKKLDNTARGLDKLIKLLKSNNVSDVYFESTGDYYFVLYYTLKGAGFKPHVLNAYQVRRPDSNKTDERDAIWLLKIGESRLFNDSYIPNEEMQLLRFLTRKKTKIAKRMADIKREISSILNRLGLNIRQLGNKLMAKNRIKTLTDLTRGKLELGNVEDDTIRAVYETLHNHGGVYYILVVETYLKELLLLKSEVEKLDRAIYHLSRPYGNGLEILMSVPGIGFDLAVKILAEIGDINRFPSPKHLASYAGLAPTSRNSGGRVRYGRPTKKSNKRLRHYMFLAALAAVRSRSPVIKGWFTRLSDRGKHFKKVVVAIARKLLTIIWHLLIKGERWAEENFSKPTKRLSRRRMPRITIAKAIEVLREAGYIVKQPDT